MKKFIFLLTLILINNTIITKNYNGSGSSALSSFLTSIIQSYNLLNPEFTFSYISTDSTQGLDALFSKMVFYAGSDVPPTPAQQAMQDDTLLNFPIVVVGIAIAFNISEYNNDLKLTAQNLSDIYTGKITNWNDSRLKANNPGLPNLTIIPIARADGSGSTNNFTSYLSKELPSWPKRLTGNGPFTINQWGNLNIILANGGSGVASAIANTNGSIGYVAYNTTQTNIPVLRVAAIQNSSGNFILPTTSSISAAAKITDVPANLHLDTINTPVPNGYPIANPSNLVVFQHQNEKITAINLAKFLIYIGTKGQSIAKSLFYGNLSKKILNQYFKNIKLLLLNGELDALSITIFNKYGCNL
jgi:phosphate transport system substrate-binding protein